VFLASSPQSMLLVAGGGLMAVILEGAYVEFE